MLKKHVVKIATASGAVLGIAWGIIALSAGVQGALVVPLTICAGAGVGFMAGSILKI